MNDLQKFICRIFGIQTASDETLPLLPDGEPPKKGTLADIPTEKTVYAVPWALDADTGKLRLSYGFTDAPQGTSCMPVKKKESGLYECRTDFPFFGGKYKW